MKSTLVLSLSLSFTFNSILCLPSHSHFRRGHALAHHRRLEARATSAQSDSIPNSDLFFTKRSLSPSLSSEFGLPHSQLVARYPHGDDSDENEQDDEEEDCDDEDEEEEEEEEEEANEETSPTSKAPVDTKPTDTYIPPPSTKSHTSSSNHTKPQPEPFKIVPVDSKPGETSINSTSSEPPKPDTKPAQHKPSETKTPVTKPVEAKPDESKPVEAKPDENKPDETKPADTPTAPQKHEPNKDSYTEGGYIHGKSSTSYAGKATFYTQDGAAGSCGQYHSDSEHIVAIDVQMYGSGEFCGKKIAVTRVSTGKTIHCIAADQCPGCASAGSLDLSTGAFDELGTRDEGTFEITWAVVS